MALNPAELTILHYPAPVLRERAKAIGKIDDTVRAVAARMIDLMHEAEGVGLAAPQVGLPWRMFVTDVPRERGGDGAGPQVYINPKLTDLGKDLEVCEEGCLSLPGVRVDVTRPTAATLTAHDLDGKIVTVQSDDFAARVWQHEFDHLNGVLIIDHLNPQERKAMRLQLKMKPVI